MYTYKDLHYTAVHMTKLVYIKINKDPLSFFVFSLHTKMSKETKEEQFIETVVKSHEYELDKDIEHHADTDSDGFIPPTPEELRKTLWKLDMRIIPFLGLLYLCSFLDRVNIGNAKLAGIVEDLKVSSSDYNVALSLFFVGYIIFEVPSNMILKKIGPSRWIPIVMIMWGTVVSSIYAKPCIYTNH